MAQLSHTRLGPVHVCSTLDEQTENVQTPQTGCQAQGCLIGPVGCINLRSCIEQLLHQLCIATSHCRKKWGVTS